jgi:hypothetical protein
VRALIEAQAERAEQIIREHYDAVDALARTLEQETVLAAETVEEIVMEHGVELPHERSRKLGIRIYDPDVGQLSNGSRVKST